MDIGNLQALFKDERSVQDFYLKIKKTLIKVASDNKAVPYVIVIE